MIARSLLALACLLLPLAAPAATRLDDSASPRARIEVMPRWQYEEGQLGGSERLHAMVATAPGVEIRLNTAAYVGKRGRIYIALPEIVSGLRSRDAMRVEFRSRGAFQSGTVLPGERALLYDGPILRAQTGDLVDFTILFDSRHMAGGLRFDPTFEIELLP
jgi:hypothetical protein